MIYLTDEAPPAITRVWRDTMNAAHPFPESLRVAVADFDAYHGWLMRNDPRGPMTRGITRGILFKGIDVIDDPSVPEGECRLGGAICQFARHDA